MKNEKQENGGSKQMTENEEFYKLTFSQREGRAPLPEPMRLEHVSQDCRHLVWFAVDNSIKRELRREPAFGNYYYERNSSMYHIVSEYTIKVLHWPTTISSTTS